MLTLKKVVIVATVSFIMPVLVASLIGGLMFFMLDTYNSPIPIRVITEGERKQIDCLAKKYRLNHNFVVYNWPDDPYITWKDRKIYMDKSKCPQ